MTAHVVYTDPPLIAAPGEQFKDNNEYTRVQVRVDTKVRDVEHGHSKPTGQFNYTFNGQFHITSQLSLCADTFDSAKEHQSDAKNLRRVYVLPRGAQTS